MHYHSVALWDRDEPLELFAPANPEHVSHSALNLQRTSTSIIVSAESLRRLMSRLGSPEITLLKMDIEGAEYRVIDHAITEGIRPKVWCIEFDEGHHGLDGDAPKRIRSYVSKLRKAGYRLVARDVWNFTFLLEDG